MLREKNKLLRVALLLLLSTLLAGLALLPAVAGAQTYHSIDVNIDEGDEAFGSVSIAGEKNEEDKYLFGTYVTLSATPNPGYEFAGWYYPGSEERLSSDLTFSEVVSRDAAYVAKFEPRVYSLVYENCPNVNFNGQVTSHTFGTVTTVPDPSRTGYTFLGWVVNGVNDPQKNLVLTGETAYSSGTVTLRAEWEAISYRVIRYDFKVALLSELGSDTWKSKILSKTADELMQNLAFLGYYDGEEGSDWLVPMGSVVKGNEGADTLYRGYHFEDLPLYYTERTVSITNEQNPNVNKVFRVYLPNVYNIVYVSDGNAITWETTTHTYDSDTEIKQYPTKVGYTFIGWNVNGTDVLLDTESGESLILGGTDYVSDITLTALWEPIRYGINYNLVGGVLDVKPTEHIFGTDTVLEFNPTKVGYTFLGWKVNGTFVPLDVAAGETLKLNATAFTAAISLEAVWEANVYHVTFDEQGATISGVLTSDVVFDATPDAMTLLPSRVGHTFMGYYTGKDGSGVKYFNADGTSARSWDIAGDTTLYACWQVNQYKVTVNVNDADVKFSFGGHDYVYPGNTAMIDYGTEITVTVTAKAAHKLVQWNSTAVAHQAVFSYTFTLGAEDVTLEGVVKPDIELPVFKVSYISDPEIFVVDGGLLPGVYRIYAEGLITLDLVVNDRGAIEVNGAPVSKLVIPEAYFGNTVYLIRFGDGVSTADSDPMPIVVKSRPAAPVENTHIKGIYADNSTIRVDMFDGLMYDYQYAISKNGTGLDLVWGSSPVFANLEPGTIYYVYCRVEAKDNADAQYPHGMIFVHEINTNYSDYVRDIISQLESLRQEGDGGNVDQLLKDAIASVNDVPKPSASFYADLQAIFNRTESAIPFARRQDEKVAALTALWKRLTESGAFNAEAIQRLDDYYNAAVASINAATTDDVVQTVYSNTVADMGAVKISYLNFVDLQMTSHAGLPQTVQLTLLRFPDFATLASSVDVAIKAENLAVKNEEMAYRLRSLDVMASYSMKLTDAGSSFTSYEGTYQFRLLLPEALRGVSGLQVAYYNERTGVLEVLDTTVDGNCLVFTANRVADFVILGDPTVNLTWLIALLSIVLFFQILSVMLIVARRSRYSSKGARRYSFLPVTLLTVQFLPQGSVTVVIILGALVILFQIVLLYLLMTSELLFRRRRSRYDEEPVARENYYATEEDLSSTEQSTETSEEEILEMAPALTTLTEDELTEEEQLLEMDEEFEDHGDSSALYGASFAPDDELSEADPNAVEEELPTEELYASEYAPEDTSYDEELMVESPEAEMLSEALNGGEEFDEENFIEPAVDPQYSLPEEEELIEEDFEEEELLPEEDEVLPEEEESLSEEAEPLTEVSVEEALYEEGEEATEEFSELPMPEDEDALSEETPAEEINEDDASEDAEDEFQPLPDAREDEEPPYYLL